MNSNESDESYDFKKSLVSQIVFPCTTIKISQRIAEEILEDFKKTEEQKR